MTDCELEKLARRVMLDAARLEYGGLSAAGAAAQRVRRAGGQPGGPGGLRGLGAGGV